MKNKTKKGIWEHRILSVYYVPGNVLDAERIVKN